MKVEINFRLWQAIKEKGYKQKDFAKLIGVDNSVVSRVVNGRMNLSDEEKERWAKALEKTVKEVF
jgi:transcriptional regulator with XRE-family HTH domain